MTPQEAHEKESAILSTVLAERQREDLLDLVDRGPTIEDDAHTIYNELRKVGTFWKDGHGHVYFSRHADGEDYRVGSNPKWRFPRFVCGLFDLSAREGRTRDVLDRIEERMRAKASPATLVLGDEAAIAAALSAIMTVPVSVSYKPLKIAAKKKKWGGSDKRAKRVRR